MRTVINQRPVALVVMDAFGKYTHFADASRLRTWIETGKVMPVPASALSYKKQREAQMAEAMLKGGAQPLVDITFYCFKHSVLLTS